MIVTARATKAQSHDALTQSIDRVLNGEMMIILGVESESPGNCQEPCRGNSLGIFFPRSVFGQQITGNLFTNEFIVWLVGIESINHIIAVTPGHGHRIICSVPGSIRIT